ALDAEDFSNGVTKVIYEFTIIDKDLNEKTEEYTIFVDEVYTVTFVVTDGAGNEVEDAIITLGEVENEANDYVFAYVKPETYSYKVEKAGYQTVEVEEVEIDRDMEIEVVLIKDLSDYSEKIMIAHSTTTGYAAYHGTSVTQSESTIIGVKYHSNTDNEIKIAVTSNCEGFVKVENDEFDTKQAVIDAYDNGAAVESLLLPRDYNAKAYAPVYFVAKVDGDYKLVKYVDGFVNPTPQENGNKGNVVVFQYKN
ncbi:MAG: carboxypeptidase regulatory-like domain-containing protein, partial [Bacteroidales bacterium]|nr:carboxypeptidase regulatory-like domain-containing protein [Bacteroidales bacterium]